MQYPRYFLHCHCNLCSDSSYVYPFTRRVRYSERSHLNELTFLSLALLVCDEGLLALLFGFLFIVRLSTMAQSGDYIGCFPFRKGFDFLRGIVATFSPSLEDYRLLTRRCGCLAPLRGTKQTDALTARQYFARDVRVTTFENVDQRVRRHDNPLSHVWRQFHSPCRGTIHSCLCECCLISGRVPFSSEGFYAYVTSTKTFQDVDIVSASYPCIGSQFQDVGRSRGIVYKCKRVLVVDVGYGLGVWKLRVDTA